MYTYPTVLTDDMIDAIAECERVCNYVDLPLQHINDRVLKAMHRRVGRASTERLLGRIRERIDGVTIRTTLIAGFPGETEAEFQELLQFVKDFRFDALGVFPYSQEPETPAGRMQGQLPQAVKDERVDALMRTQQEIAFELAEGRIGEEFAVLVDERVDSSVVIGRHGGQAPTVDSVTYVEGTDAEPGQFVAVRCTSRNTYDLVARPADAALPVLGP
jgi:ribosomal protein S12 methylthiotransferase